MTDTWAPLYPIFANIFLIMAIGAFLFVGLIIVGLIIFGPNMFMPQIPKPPKVQFPKGYYD